MKKEIIVKEENRQKLEAALEEVQGRCTVRTISVDSIFRSCKKLDDYLDITKKSKNGVTVCVDLMAQDFPNAYTNRHTPKSTQFYLRYYGGSWRVTKIERDRTKAAGHEYTITLTEEAKQAVLDAVSKMRF